MQIHELSLGWRLLFAAAWTIGAGVTGAGMWMFGILMFTFSMDGASPNNVPNWLEPYMLLGWPLVIAATVLAPAVMLLYGAPLGRTLATFAGLAATSVCWILAGWLVLVIRH